MNRERFFRPDYTAHPILDPDYIQKDEAGARALFKAFHEMKSGAAAYNQHLNRLFRPLNDPRPLEENKTLIHRYLREVDLYIRELLKLVPPEPAERLRPLDSVTGTNDFLDLLERAFLAADRRERFEAQRKVYLARLFFDVDHTFDVQRGQAHSQAFEEMLKHELWSHVTHTRHLTIGYSVAPDGRRMEYSLGEPKPGQDTWPVELRRIRREVGGKDTAIHVFYYSCRFKRQYRLKRSEGSRADGNMVEERIWAALQGGRSGSIVSKMVRKGEVDPQKIGDLIGAMFIVKDADEVIRLKEMLFDIFGGPLRWLEEIDTISSEAERARLSEFSADSYQVNRSRVGILYRPPDSEDPPYLFNVEFQLYTLEGFLRTVHGRHHASHQSLKLRQFLEGVLPYVFPASVYGRDTFESCLPPGEGGAVPGTVAGP